MHAYLQVHLPLQGYSQLNSNTHPYLRAILTYVYTYIHKTHTCMHTCRYTCPCKAMRALQSTQFFAAKVRSTYMYVCICAYRYLYVCICVHMCICVHIQYTYVYACGSPWYKFKAYTYVYCICTHMHIRICHRDINLKLIAFELTGEDRDRRGNPILGRLKIAFFALHKRGWTRFSLRLENFAANSNAISFNACMRTLIRAKHIRRIQINTHTHTHTYT